ncbi:MAG: formate--tetrahydrofolate ligase [Thermoplasmata archaeon]
MRPIGDVAFDVGLKSGDVVPAGPGVVKIPLRVARPLTASVSRGKLVLVTAMTPTVQGEGKTVVAIGLAMALHGRGRRAIVCLRQPSLGPVFGLKGGASGGGRSTVEPRPAIDLGFTGDLDAITNAQNLLASLVDNHIFHGNPLALDGTRPVLPRTSPLEDRSLRDILSGLSEKAPGFPRPGQFVITPASEMAAIHALASDYADLQGRIGRMTAGRRADGVAIRASELGSIGAVAGLLRSALEPNLVQTVEGTPAFVHGAPYANVAHGTCSRLSIELGLGISDFAIVEAGFSTELGAEKFVDIVSPQTRLTVDAVVLVASIRALRWHGNGGPGSAPPGTTAVRRGLANLEQHVENLRRMGLDPVIGLNRFLDDSSEDIAEVQRFCTDHRLSMAVVTSFADGGRGANDLAERVIEACHLQQRSRSLYPEGASVEKILHTVVTEIYGGNGFEMTDTARSELDRLRADHDADGPVCIAKTPLSLSADPTLRGRPRDFIVTVRHFFRWPGAGFTVAMAGPVASMPGLPLHPSAEAIRLSKDGVVTGVG